jgi:hypothetical protein
MSDDLRELLLVLLPPGIDVTDLNLPSEMVFARSYVSSELIEDADVGIAQIIGKDLGLALGHALKQRPSESTAVA